MVRAPDLKSGNPEFKSRPDHQLDLFQVVPDSTPRLRLYIVNWSASCLLAVGILNLLSLFQRFVSLARGQLSIHTCIRKYHTLNNNR